MRAIHLSPEYGLIITEDGLITTLEERKAEIEFDIKDEFSIIDLFLINSEDWFWGKKAIVTGFILGFLMVRFLR
ncbi:MAG: hypothetical protein ACE5K4_05260 [Candidatus Hydrothermarchaeota archaeon]